MEKDKYRKYWNEAVETMPREEIKTLQEKRMQRQLRHVYNHSVLLHRLYSEAGITPEDIKTIEDFKKVPFLDKDFVREERQRTGDPFGGVLCIPRERIYAISTSTGTTGPSTYAAWTKDDGRVLYDIESRGVWSMGVRPTWKSLLVAPICWHGATPYFITVADITDSTKSAMMDIDVLIDAKKCLAIARSFKPDFFYCATDIALRMMEEAKTLELDLKEELPNLKLVTHTGDIFPDPLRKRFVDEWGGIHLDSYGLGDLGFYMFECIDAQMGSHMPEDAFLLELVDPDTGERLGVGERGELTVSPLLYEGTPLIRYQTDDVGTIIDEPCICGRTHNRVRVIGREGQIMDVAGKKLMPWDIEGPLRAFPETEFSEFSLVRYSSEMDKIRIKMTYDEEITSDPTELKERVECRIREELGVECEVEFCKSEDLPRLFWKVIRIIELQKE